MKKLLLTAALALAASSAFAVTAQSGVYVNGNLGFSIPNTWDIDGITNTNQGYTGGVAVGYDYALNQTFLVGAEAGYTYFGKTKYDLPADLGSFNTEYNAIQLFLTGIYLNQNGFNLFGKVGAAYMTENISGSGYSTGFTYANGDNSLQEWQPAVAVGAGYMLIQNLNLALQYEHVFGADNPYGNTTRPQAQNAITLNLIYKF